MSLPSKVKYVMKGKVIGESFCNVGWYVDQMAIHTELKRLSTAYKELYDFCDHFEMYGYSIPKEHIYNATKWVKL
jgi:hypothetical protein